MKNLSFKLYSINLLFSLEHFYLKQQLFMFRGFFFLLFLQEKCSLYFKVQKPNETLYIKLLKTSSKVDAKKTTAQEEGTKLIYILMKYFAFNIY